MENKDLEKVVETTNTNENQDWFTRPLRGKEKVVALAIAFVLAVLVTLSPVISPLLVSWIEFDTPFWDAAETVAGYVILFGILGGGIWLAVRSVKKLGNTCKDVFGKKD